MKHLKQIACSIILTGCMMTFPVILAKTDAHPRDNTAAGHTALAKRRLIKPVSDLSRNTLPEENTKTDTSEELMDINVIFSFDDRVLEPGNLYSSWYHAPWIWETNDLAPYEERTIQVTPSTKELVAVFLPKEGSEAIYDNNSLVVIAKEFDRVEEGMSVIFDAADAVNHIQFEVLDETGAPFHDDVENDQVQETVNFFHAIHGKMGGKTVIIDCFEEDPAQKMSPSVYVNDLSDNFGVSLTVHTMRLFCNDHVAIKMPTVNKAGLYRNDVSLFRKHEVRAALPKYTRDALGPDLKLATSITYSDPLNGYSDDETTLAKPEFFHPDPESPIEYVKDNMAMKYYVLNLPEPTFDGIDTHELLVRETTGELPCPEGLFDDARMAIWSPPLRMKDGELQMLPYNMTIWEDWSDDPYQRTLDNTTNPSYFPKVNPNLVTPVDKIRTVAANNVPILVSLLAYMEEAGPLPDEYYADLVENEDLQFGYVGRCQELRKMDYRLARCSHSVNDTHHVFTLTNDNTFIDNSIDGVNVTELGLGMNRADFVPPTLQSLTFRDAEGYINDRFETGEGAQVEIYAGDFYYYLDMDTYADMMKCRPLDEIVFEYAPKGSTEFQKLPLTEDPDKFFLPGYGHFYSAPLADVTADNYSGWFDARISLRDASGNYQKQLISPAFFMSKPRSGVYTMHDDSVDIPAEYFNLQGVRIANPEPGQTVICRRGYKSEKIIVR